MWTAGIQMKWICDHRSELQSKQFRNSPKKVFRGFNGIRTRGLCGRAAVLYHLSYEDPYSGKQSNLLSSSTRERNETQNEMMWTAGIQMKWICDHRSELQSKQLQNSPKKVFRGFNGIRTRGRCGRAAVLYHLSYEDPYNGKQSNLLSSSTPWKEWNCTQNFSGILPISMGLLYSLEHCAGWNGPEEGISLGPVT